MQTLWTRVAQVRGSCRCPQCLSTANGVSRRTTASATRRMPRYLTSSTLLYSGIFAAAATFDGRIKKQRKEQWELAIAEVKQELRQTAPSADHLLLDAQQDDFKRAFILFLGPVEDKTVGERLSSFEEYQRSREGAGCSYRPFFGSFEDQDFEQLAHVSHSEQRRQEDATIASKFLESVEDEDAFDELDAGAEDERSLEDSTIAYEPFFGLREGENVTQLLDAKPQDGKIASERDLELSEDEDPFLHVTPRRPKPRWPANTGPRLRGHLLPPQSIYATEERNERASHMQWSPKRLAMVQGSVEMLLSKIFLQLKGEGISQEAAAAVPEHFAENILRSSEELIRRFKLKGDDRTRLTKATADLSDYQPLEDDSKLCKYSQDDMDSALRVVADLNSSLRKLFEMQANQVISTPSLLARLSYNLAVSPAPPTLNTFNTLLLGLVKAEQPVIANHVIRSMRMGNMRLNEVSLVAILKHFTNTNQPSRFIHWIGLLRGKSTGLALAHPESAVDDSGRGRLLVHRAGYPDRIIQLPYPTPDVFGALVAGVLKFADFEAALSICERMGGEGWGLCMAGLTPLLQNCAARGDWTSGLAVWAQIQALKASSRRREGSRFLSETIRVDTYATMLRLCSRCKKRNYFDEIWDDAMRTHRQADEKLLELIKGQSDAAPDVTTKRRKPNANGVGVLSGTIITAPDEAVVPLDQAQLDKDLPSRPNHQMQVNAACNVLNGLQVATDDLGFQRSDLSKGREAGNITTGAVQ